MQSQIHHFARLSPLRRCVQSTSFTFVLTPPLLLTPNIVRALALKSLFMEQKWYNSMCEHDPNLTNCVRLGLDIDLHSLDPSNMEVHSLSDSESIAMSISNSPPCRSLSLSRDCSHSETTGGVRHLRQTVSISC